MLPLTLFLVLALPLQLAGAYALLRAGLRRAPGRWAAWLLLAGWLGMAVVLDQAVVQELRAYKKAPTGEVGAFYLELSMARKAVLSLLLQS